MTSRLSLGRNRPQRPPMARRPWHVRVNALVIAWFLAAFVVAVAHRWIPEANYLMVHLMLLGAVTTAILIWSAHFADTLLGRPAPGGQGLMMVRLGVHTVSAILVILGVTSGRWGLVVAGLAFVGAVTTVVTRWVSARIGEGLILDLRREVFAHVLRQPVAFFTRSQTGALVSRLNSDVIGAQGAFTSVLSGLFGNLLTMVFIVVALLSMSWQITALALLLLPLFLVPARLMGARLSALTRRQMVLNADMQTRMTERFNVAGALLVRLFGRPAQVTCRGDSQHCTTLYEYDSAAPPRHVTAEAAWDNQPGFGFRMRYTIVLERATIDFDLGRAADVGGPLVISEGDRAEPVGLASHTGYDGEIRAMLRAIAQGAANPPATLEQAAAVIEMLCAERTSARERTTVVLAR